jgi:hypothetical protein
VRAVSGSGHGVSVVQALAGTGKTYTAGVLRQVYEGAGYTVLGVAPTGRAVRELAEGRASPRAHWTGCCSTSSSSATSCHRTVC